MGTGYLRRSRKGAAALVSAGGAERNRPHARSEKRGVPLVLHDPHGVVGVGPRQLDDLVVAAAHAPLPIVGRQDDRHDLSEMLAANMDQEETHMT